MTLTAEQQSAWDVLTQRIPDDLTPPYVPPGTSDPYKDNKWLATMRKVSRQEKQKAASKNNLIARPDRPNRDKAAPTRIMSAEMFPADITVSYLAAPYLGYMAPSKPRKVKFIVLHSFGRAWHASSTGTSGWLNDTRPGTGAVPYELEVSRVKSVIDQPFARGGGLTIRSQLVGIARGSDPVTLSHSDRMNSIIQAAVGPNSRTCMHYLIDRAGNLTVIGDANFIMFSSDYANEAAISIGLEEALYVLKPTAEEPAVWKSDGSPPGTGGNVKYFAFSSAQLLTLSIVCKKLEVAFAIPQTISISRRSLDADSPPGYTMHDFVRGATHVDVSPHFLTKALWDDFFKLVNTHTNINPTNVWEPIPKYTDSADELITAPISDVPVERTTEIAIENSRYMSLGRSRSLAKSSISKNEVNNLAGKEALVKSETLERTAANAYNFMQQEQNLPVSGVEEELTSEDQGGWDDIWLEEI